MCISAAAAPGCRPKPILPRRASLRPRRWRLAVAGRWRPARRPRRAEAAIVALREGFCTVTEAAQIMESNSWLACTRYQNPSIVTKKRGERGREWFPITVPQPPVLPVHRLSAQPARREFISSKERLGTQHCVFKSKTTITRFTIPKGSPRNVNHVDSICWLTPASSSLMMRKLCFFH